METFAVVEDRSSVLTFLPLVLLTIFCPPTKQIYVVGPYFTEFVLAFFHIRNYVHQDVYTRTRLNDAHNIR